MNAPAEIVLLSHPEAWFAYPFWLDEASASDYARTVDIHRKPGYDPCELFLTRSCLAQGPGHSPAHRERSSASGRSST